MGDRSRASDHTSTGPGYSAARNTLGGQWGYSGAYAFSGSVIDSLDWSPLVSDHIHETGQAFSPCVNTGYLFDNGKVNIKGSLVSTSAGSVIQWQNIYSFQSRMNQSWPRWTSEQALYLNKRVASMGDLRIYLRKGSSTVGPIRPASRFSIPGATCVQNNGSFCNTGAYDYAVLVWNILGLDVGIAISDLSNGISLNMEERTYCTNASDLSCGNISFHSWMPGGSGSIPAGAIRSVSKSYYIGTLPQLAALGYTIQ